MSFQTVRNKVLSRGFTVTLYWLERERKDWWHQTIEVNFSSKNEPSHLISLFPDGILFQIGWNRLSDPLGRSSFFF